jgi:hypothetical protein
MVAGRGSSEEFLCKLIVKQKEPPLGAHYEHALGEVKLYTHSRLICSFTIAPTQRSNGVFHVALVPDAARKSDIICSILGCTAPVVLRQFGDYYKVLGEAYIHEKSVRDADEGWRRLEDFLLR